MKDFVLLLMRVYLLHFIILYHISQNKADITEDIKVMKEKTGLCYSEVKALVYLLTVNRYYRNIFYNRIGSLSLLVSWMLPKAKSFFPCLNIGGGIYCAHPFSTILNAKSIGKRFSVRNNTTVGNKYDGEGANGPEIGNDVYLGANVCIIGDIRIGNNVTIGAGTVVVKDVPDNCVVVGNPARIIKKL